MPRTGEYVTKAENVIFSMRAFHADSIYCIRLCRILVASQFFPVDRIWRRFLQAAAADSMCGREAGHLH